MRAATLFLALAFIAYSGAAAESRSGAEAELETAIFAGGCFWCMEKAFDDLDGVVRTTSGYSGGDIVNPSYEEVTSGDTGHREVVQVTYDAEKVSYQELLDVFWPSIDPFDIDGQFCDRGFQYSAAIYYGNEEERRLARESREQVEDELGREVVTEIEQEAEFYPAEDYHQNYYKENPLKYRFYRWRCGRDARLEQVWGKR